MSVQPFTQCDRGGGESRGGRQAERLLPEPEAVEAAGAQLVDQRRARRLVLERPGLRARDEVADREVLAPADVDGAAHGGVTMTLLDVTMAHAARTPAQAGGEAQTGVSRVDSSTKNSEIPSIPMW